MKYLAFLAVLGLAAPAHAITLEDAALDLARITVNEAPWRSTDDMLLIWQTTASHGDTVAERIVWLRGHSARVLGARHCAPGRNCRWTRHLSWSGEEPEEWPEGASWEARRPLWEQTLARALRVVSGAERAAPCPVAPDTWGGPRDRAGALEAGFHPLQCVGTINTGWLWAPRARLLAVGD
jgi:hypothetical protein